MRHSIPLAMLVVLLTAIAGCGVFDHRSPGEKLWDKYCADCHGVDGAGNTVKEMGNTWADLRDDQWKTGGDPESIEQVIRAGVFAEMPAHDELSGEETKAIIDWLYHLRGETE